MSVGEVRVVGWGPFRLPGEVRRFSSAIGERKELLKQRGERLPVVAERTEVPRDQDEDLPRLSLGDRKLYLLAERPWIKGGDVRDLQERLAVLGHYESEVDGVFGPKTREALVLFQRRHGVFVDGVCARVSVIVLDFLQRHHISSANELAEEQRHQILFATSAQRSGMILLLPLDGSKDDGGGKTAGAVLSNAIARKIENDAEMQALEVSPFLETLSEQVAYTDGFRAETVILLDVRRDEGRRNGVAVFYFSPAGVEGVASPVGHALADLILDELVENLTADDLGSNPEDSEMLQMYKSPTVRIEVGIDLVANADEIGSSVARAVVRNYLLGAQYAPSGSAPVGPLSRRNGGRDS